MRNNKGFSLVELIVVIAIMAILASVAVVGVSVYVPKAQKAADEQLVADIQKAIDLYAQLEGAELQPGQSGYVVIKKTGSNGGGAISFVVMPVGAEDDVQDDSSDNKHTEHNVTTGGTLNADNFLHNALVNYFGADYGTELKVSYGEWTGSFNENEIAAVQGSVYTDQNNGVNNMQDLMQSVDSLTGVLSAYYGGDDADYRANSAVLAVAQNANGLSQENYNRFVTWWSTEPLSRNLPPLDIFGDPTKPETIMSAMAAQYAQYKAVVLSTGCGDCMSTFADTAPFGGTQDSEAAKTALQAIIDATTNHYLYGNNGTKCETCAPKIEGYTNSSGAANDAKAYLAILGEVHGMSGEIKNEQSFGSAGFFKGEYIQGVVNEYLTEIDAYSADAKIGDIVISVTVDLNGNIKFKNNLTE